MRESRIVFLQYLTGLAIFFFGALHYASLTFLGVSGYDQALRYDVVIAKYRDVVWALMLSIFLIMVTSHTFIGFRNILIELIQGRRWESAINACTVILGSIVFAYGVRTIVFSFMGW